MIRLFRVWTKCIMPQGNNNNTTHKIKGDNDIPTGLGGRGNGNGNITHRVGSLWHWQLPELRAFMIILMMTDVQCGEEVGEKPQDVDNGQLVGGIRLWGEENQVLDLPVPACPLAPALTASSSPTPP